jgi:5'-nucleotidase
MLLKNTDLWHDVVEENPITNLLADELVDVFKTDIGIINSGLINGGALENELMDNNIHIFN